MLAEEQGGRLSDLPEVQRRLRKALRHSTWWASWAEWFRAVFQSSPHGQSPVAGGPTVGGQVNTLCGTQPEPTDPQTPYSKVKPDEAPVLPHLVERDESMATKRKSWLSKLQGHVGDRHWPEAVDSLMSVAHSYRGRNDSDAELLRGVARNVIVLLEQELDSDTRTGWFMLPK